MRIVVKWIASVLLFTVIIEVVFSIVILVQDSYFSKGHVTINVIREKLLEECESDNDTYFIAQPNLTFVNNPSKTVDGVPLVNAHGYRGNLVPLEKRDEKTVRILFLGESTTYGYGVTNYRDAFPHVVDSLLGDAVEVINAGLLAATSSEALSHYMFKYKYYNPDIVVIKLGMNELNRYLVSSDFQPDYTHHRNSQFDIPRIPTSGKTLLKSKFLSWVLINAFYLPRYNYGFALENEGNPYANFIHWFPESIDIDSLNRVQDFRFSPYFSNLKALIKGAKSDGAQVMLVTNIFNPKFSDSESEDWEHYKYYSRLYNSINRLLADSEGVNLVDLGKLDVPESSWIDDCHLDKKGHQLIASYVRMKIQELITSSQRNRNSPLGIESETLTKLNTSQP